MGGVGLGAVPALLLLRFPKAARRTRRATFTAPGSPWFLPWVGSGSGGAGVGDLGACSPRRSRAATTPTGSPATSTCPSPSKPTPKPVGSTSKRCTNSPARVHSHAADRAGNAVPSLIGGRLCSEAGVSHPNSGHWRYCEEPRRIDLTLKCDPRSKATPCICMGGGLATCNAGGRGTAEAVRTRTL